MTTEQFNNMDLPDTPPVLKKRGRPVTGKAMSNAERQARNRNWKKLHAEFEADRRASAFAHITDNELCSRLSSNPSDPAAKDIYLELGRRRGWI